MITSTSTATPNYAHFDACKAPVRFLPRSAPEKVTGIDNLPPGMLRDAALILAKPLTYVINLSLKSGIVPTDWTIAKVIPLHKSGSQSTIDNYRPISVYPTLSKILERMFYNQLMAHFEKNGLLYTHQFGFRSKRINFDKLVP